MGKNIVVVLFLAAFVVAIHAYLTRAVPIKIQAQVPEGQKEPRLMLEDFTVYKYENHQIAETLAAKLGYFQEPNMLELYGNIRGLRHTVNKEYFSADVSVTYFEARGLSQLLKNAAIIKAEVQSQVTAGAAGNTLKTEYAEYIAPQSLLRSDLAVTIDGARGRFRGEKGFEYFVDEDLLNIRGPLEGELQPEEKP